MAGEDWEAVTGATEGVTQQSRRRPWSLAAVMQPSQVVWNHPLTVAYRSTNPYGWPRLVVAVYGPDVLGRDQVRGYGVVHLPCAGGQHQLQVPLFTPQATTAVNALLSTLSGRAPEFLDMKFLAGATGRQVASTQSSGYVTVQLSVMLKDLHACGYNNTSA